MRLQYLILLTIAATVVLAREDTTETCSGTSVCDVGYCCSSHGFCGRSTLHCSHTSGCNAEKGYCGVIILDKQDMPRVITYDEISRGTYARLAKSLESEGSHVSPDDVKSSTTIEAILQKGLVEKEKMLALKPADPVAANPVPAAANPVPAAVDTGKNVAKETTPVKTNQASKVNAGVAGLFLSAVTAFFL